MRGILILLALVTATAGCVVEDRPVNPSDGGADASPCPPCEDPTPVCNEDTETCVECSVEQQDELCDSGAPFCSPAGDCVVCVDDSACTTVTAAKCNQETYVCESCDADRQCDDVDGFLGTANACADGICVDCTPQSEDTSCPGDPTSFSCDPNTNTCTTTEVGSRGVCETCITDSECGDDEGMTSDAYRCVEMFYPDMGTRFPDEETGFCLKTTVEGCEQPYSITLSDRPSLSGPPAEDYCGINESLATCPAVRGLQTNDRCDGGTDEECDQPSGLCRQVGNLENRCTYQCVSLVECLKNEPDGRPGSTCGASGTSGEDYCGG